MSSFSQRGCGISAKSTLRRRRLWTVVLIASLMIVWMKLSTSWGSNLMSSGTSFEAIDKERSRNPARSIALRTTADESVMVIDNNGADGSDSHTKPPKKVAAAAADESQGEATETDTPRQTTPSVHPLPSSSPALRLVKDSGSTERSENDAVPKFNQSKSGKLRIDWSNMGLKTDLAKEIHQHMHNCSIPRANYNWRIHRGTGRNNGLGSELHTYQTVLVAGMDSGYRPQAVGHWDWYDKQACDGSRTMLSCYFPSLEPECPNDVIVDTKISRAGCLHIGTQRFYDEKNVVQQVRPALTEAMFSSVSPLVLSEAQRQLNKVFSDGIVPPNLITVHIRWGDKANEMVLLEMDEYIKKIREMVEEHKLSPVNILLCTEDPVAVDAFKQLSPSEWSIHLDHFYVEYSPYRGNSTYNVASNVAVSLNGKAGLWALASALVAAEANYYVLTIKSNWSRLINELRQIVEARINVTTYMTNLGKDYDC